MKHLLAILLLAMASVLPAADAELQQRRTVNVDDLQGLRQALAEARPGDTIRLAPGRYGSLFAEGPRGTAEAPVVIESRDPADPAVFGNEASGIHLVAPRHIVLRNLVVRDVKANGVNIDDGGKRDGQARGVRIENVRVEHVGPAGNNDAIKLSGLDDFRVTGCTVVGWASSGVDMVGCHDGLVENCTFRGKDGFSQSNAVQIKGGCRKVVVRNCLMVNPGHRGVNLGGSTGQPYFRPPLEKMGTEAYEASECVVEGCRFIGGQAAVAFVSQTDCVVRYNTIYRPRSWAFRILQESVGPTFVPSRRGTVEHNVIVWQSGEMRAAINVGGNTEPRSFVFRANLWHCEGQPAASRPDLPADEAGGVYGVDPKLKDPAKEDLLVTEPRATGQAGAESLPPPKEKRHGK